jgi:cobalt-zinc-cadmium efflux system membrane fusion protein
MNFNAVFAFIKTKFSKFSKNEQIVISIISIVIFTLVLKNLFLFFIHLYPKPTHDSLIRKHGEIIIPDNSPVRRKIKILKITQKIEPQEYIIPGYAETNSKKDIDIFSPLNGRIVHIPIKLGDWVVKDQILAVINAPDLAQLYSSYKTAKAELKLSKQLLERAIKVNLAGANAKKDVEIATKNNLQAIANLKSIKERIKIYGKNKYSKIYLRAPSNAYVSTIYLGKGSYITDITNPLMTIINIEKIWITANVPEYLISKLQAKQMVTFQLISNPHKIYHVRISFINPRMDEKTRTNKTRISIKNPDGLIKPDMFAQVKLFIPQQSKIIIPTSAILMDYESTSVFVEIQPWVFKRKVVEIGYENNGKIEILSGLNPGDKIAASGGIFIND